MKRLAIIGAGDLGQQIAHMASEYCQREIAGYFDDTLSPDTAVADSGKVLGPISATIEHFKKDFFDEFVVAIGYHHLGRRAEIYRALSTHIPAATLVHPSCSIDRSASIGRGSIIYPGCIIDQHARIAENVILQIGCLISHHSQIQDHSFLAPSVSIAGKSVVGPLCFLGISTTVIDHIQIGRNITIGAAATVTKNLETPGTYVGTPALKANIS